MSDATTGGGELLRIEGVTKAYPGVVANSDVSFTIQQGEVHALLGENGAGKSTLVKMIYGLVKPDSGRMRLRGADYAPSQPSVAPRRRCTPQGSQAMSMKTAQTSQVSQWRGCSHCQRKPSSARTMPAISRPFVRGRKVYAR